MCPRAFQEAAFDHWPQNMDGADGTDDFRARALPRDDAAVMDC
jgi:hypothetical protein